MYSKFIFSLFVRKLIIIFLAKYNKERKNNQINIFIREVIYEVKLVYF
jgi:hypothetical protein